MSCHSPLLVSFSVSIPLFLLLSLENIPNKSLIETALSRGVLVQMKMILLINSLKLQKCDFTQRVIYYSHVVHQLR